MAAPSKRHAITGLVFVGAAALAIVILAAAFSITMRLLNVDLAVVQQSVVPLVVTLSAGTWAAQKYRKRGGA